MKNFKFLMPMLAFVMAVGMAFANKANVQSAGWIEVDGIATQLSNDPCLGQGNVCEVTFEEDDENRVFTVYTNENLLIPKSSSSQTPYSLPGMPD